MSTKTRKKIVPSWAKTHRFVFNEPDGQPRGIGGRILTPAEAEKARFDMKSPMEKVAITQARKTPEQRELERLQSQDLRDQMAKSREARIGPKPFLFIAIETEDGTPVVNADGKKIVGKVSAEHVVRAEALWQDYRTRAGI